MQKPLVIKYYFGDSERLNDLKYDYDRKEGRPAWIHIKELNFNPRFLSVRTKTESEIIYKRFTGNFYCPVSLSISKDEEKRFYQKYAQFYDQNSMKNNLPMAKFLLDKLKSLGVSKEAKILDLGAGTGIFSDLAVQNGFTNVTLVDISKSMLEIAKSKPSLEKARFIQGNITEVDLVGNYDSAISVMMFDAISEKDLPKALEKVKSALNPGGYILLIEDKKRKAYSSFHLIEDGVVNFIEAGDLTKYYFIGRN